MSAACPTTESPRPFEPVAPELKREVDAAFRHYESRLFHAALRITRNDNDAWDAVQDGMMSALRHAERFRGEAAVASWLYSIVVNAALYQRRREKAARRHRDRYSERVWPEAERSLEAGSAVRDPESFLMARIDLSRVAEVIEALPAERRGLIERSMEGDTAAEIAERADEPVSAVKSRLWRARVTLRRSLSVEAA